MFDNRSGKRAVFKLKMESPTQVHRQTSSRRFIDRFDQLDTSLAIAAVANRTAVVFDGPQKVFNQTAMAADIRHDRGRGAGVFIADGRTDQSWIRGAQI